MDDLIKQKNFKEYGNKVYLKVNNFFTKIDELKSKVIEKVKKMINESFDSLAKVTNTSNKTIDEIQNGCFFGKENDFKLGLGAVEAYNQFRKIFRTAEEEQSSLERSIYGDKLLKMEEEVKRYSDLLENLANHLKKKSNFEEAIKHHLDRVGKLYKVTTVNMCVTATYELKFLLSDKISKLMVKYEILTKKKNFLIVPLKLEEACNEANAEILRSNEKIEEIRKLYFGLCESIVYDHSQRQEFLNNYGAILPKEIFSNVIGPTINRSHLRQLLKFSSESRNLTESELKSLAKEDLINYYEGKLGLLERNYSQQIEDSKKKGKKLQDHLFYLKTYKNKLAKVIENNKSLLREYAESLLSLRSKSASEKFVNQFQKEVLNLKEKEEAFKRIHSANLKHLIEENKNLRSKINY